MLYGVGGCIARPFFTFLLLVENNAVLSICRLLTTLFVELIWNCIQHMSLIILYEDLYALDLLYYVPFDRARTKPYTEDEIKVQN